MQHACSQYAQTLLCTEQILSQIEFAQQHHRGADAEAHVMLPKGHIAPHEVLWQVLTPLPDWKLIIVRSESERCPHRVDCRAGVLHTAQAGQPAAVCAAAGAAVQHAPLPS